METGYCDNCKNYTGELLCRAFPEAPGIPLAILEGRFDHATANWPGDNGILFEPREDLQGTPDFSSHTNQSIVDFLRALPSLLGQKKSFVKVVGNPDALKNLDSYLAYDGRRLLISQDVIGKVAEAAAVILRPVLVMRDFFKRPDNNQRTYSEQFIGLTKFKDGRPAVVMVETNRDLIIRVATRDRQNLDDIIDALSGVMVFKRGY